MDKGSHEDKDGLSRQSLELWLAKKLASVLNAAPSEIRSNTTFADYGIGSLDAVTIAGELEQLVGRKLPATLAYEYPTIAALTAFLSGGGLAAPEQAAVITAPEPIAIVGIGCRFPGNRSRGMGE